MGVAGHAESVDEAGGEDGLLKTIGAALSVEVRKDQADGAEVVARIAEGVEELAELGTLLGGRLAPLHPSEETAEHAELGVGPCPVRHSTRRVSGTVRLVSAVLSVSSEVRL